MIEWLVRGGSVAGSAHDSRGVGSNDAFLTSVDGPTAIVAVADGAGSAAHSTLGATTAVAAAVEALRGGGSGYGDYSPAARDVALRNAVESARAAVLDAAASLCVEPSELACTLLLCVVRDGEVGAAQVGDGAIVGFVDHAYRLLCELPRSEFLNETVFLTSDAALAELNVRHTKAAAPGDLRHIAVFSDGLQTLALHLADDVPHSPFFDPMFKWAVREDASEAMLSDFLRSSRVREKTDDDVTLVLVADRDAPLPVVTAEPITRGRLSGLVHRRARRLERRAPRLAAAGRATWVRVIREWPRVLRAWAWMRRHA
ncbi:MAG: PP2C family serine/threonine-protein phosphatase [Chloroflexi bacterium]|nr:PP2C family serine/threonine-protein phosphatase [Chloroflexota bacterium]